MRSLLSSTLFFLMLLKGTLPTPLLAQGNGIAPSQEAADERTRANPVRVVYPVVMPPYTFEDDAGEAQGLAPDLLRLWSEKTGIAIQFASAPWDEGLQMMRDGQADLHASLYYAEERDTYLDYATVVASSAGSIFFHKNILGLNGPEDLKAYRVGAVRGSYHEQYIQEHLPDVSLVSYREFPEMLDAAQKGDIRVFVEDIGTTLYRLKQRGLLDQFRYNPARPLYRNNFWLAIREGDTNLAETLRQGMALITPEERAAIERTWLGTSAVRTQDVLDIAIQSDFPPFTFVNAEGQPAGLFVDIWRLWAEKTGRTIEFRATRWNDSLNSLKTGGVDIHSGLFYSDARAEWIDYSQPFYETGSCFFYSGSQEPPDEPGSYAGTKISVVRGSYQEEYLREQYPDVDVITFATVEGMLRAVADEEVFACLSEAFSTQALIDRLGLSGAFNADATSLFTREFHAGVLKDNTELLALVEEAFNTITIGELAEIEKRWIVNPKRRYYNPPARQVSLTEKERVWLQAHPDITLGYTDTFEPEVIVGPDGSLRGIQVDILDELNRRLGTSIRLSIDPVPALIEKAQKKEVDGILSLHPGYADELGLLKTRSYFTGYPAVFSLRNVPFNRPSDLAGKRIAIIDAVFFSEQIVEQYGDGVTLLKVKDALEGLQSVERGEADLFLGASLNAYLITKYQLLDLTIQYVFYDDGINGVIGTRSDWPELSAILDKGLSIFSKGEIDAIVGKWIQLPSPKEVIELTPEEQAWLVKKHTVRVRVIDYPPFMILGKGEPKGISVDYLKLISERTGIKFEFVEETRPLADALEAVKNLDGLDLIQCRTHTAERESYVSFTKDYLASPRVIFTRTGGMFVSGIEDLKGKTVAVAKGTVASTQLASQFPGIHLMLLDTDEQSLEAVVTGRADAYIGNLTFASYLILGHGLANVKVAAPTPLGDHVFSFGIRKDWPELNSLMDKAIDAIPPEEVAALRSKYMSVRYEYGIQLIDVVKWILLVAGIAAVALSVFAFWNRSLNRLVRERTSKLAESEERFRATFEQAAVGIAHVSPEGRFLRVNQRFCDIVGYSYDEMLAQTFQDITYPDDLEADLELTHQLLAGEKETYSMEKRYFRKNGETVWINLTVSLLREETGEPRWFVSAVEDITARKKAEEQIQKYQQRLKALASQLTIAEERERRRIAADLHDHVQQSLAAARLQLAAARRPTSQAKLTAALDDISESLREALEDTRQLVFDLSSPSMNEIGLAAAVSEWLREQVERRHGLKTECVDECGDVSVDEDVRAILFRSVRELLANVVKHAKANQVSVHLKRVGADMRIIVRDDGIGFDPTAVSDMIEAKGGFGLFSIRERMNDLGGLLEIVSEPGKGCEAILTVPLKG